MEPGMIYDPDKVKILILFTMSQLEKPVPMSLLNDIFLNSGLIDYFTLSESIDDLEKTGHIAIDTDDKIAVLTRLGFQASRELHTQLPFYAREKAVKGAKDLLEKVDREAGVHVSTNYENRQYKSTFMIKDGEEILLKLELFMPSYESAMRCEENFKKNSSDVYRAIVKALSLE